MRSYSPGISWQLADIGPILLEGADDEEMKGLEWWVWTILTIGRGRSVGAHWWMIGGRCSGDDWNSWNVRPLIDRMIGLYNVITAHWDLDLMFSHMHKNKTYSLRINFNQTTTFVSLLTFEHKHDQNMTWPSWLIKGCLRTSAINNSTTMLNLCVLWTRL